MGIVKGYKLTPEERAALNIADDEEAVGMPLPILITGAREAERLMTLLTPEDFNATFDQFEHTCVRLEQFQRYTVEGEEARIQAWREGQPRPERSPRTSPWLRRVQDTTRAGKAWSRYRIVEHPLSEYIQYQMVGYQESAAAGDQVLIVDRAADPRLSDLDRDWWGFDLEHPSAFVVLMNYTPDRRPLQHELTHDPAIIQECRRQLALVRDLTVPLRDYLST